MTDRIKRIIILVIAVILLIAVVSFVASRLFGGEDNSAQTSQTRSAGESAESTESANTPAQTQDQQAQNKPTQAQPSTQGAHAGGSSTALTNSGPGETAALLFVVAFVAGTALHQVVVRKIFVKS